MFWTLVFVSSVCLLLYLFFIERAVLGAVERTHLQNELATFDEKVSSLESAYIAAKESVTIHTALELGLTETPEAVFVSKKALGQALVTQNEI